ncbi:MAG: hypothetical protein GQ569_02750 [Methylococcaceae bacterium]|nr:hypothetical protein [Methylococcaceae bacterium]
MKNLFKIILIFSALVVSHNATAYSSKGASEQCKMPRFDNFSLAEYSSANKVEVAPESEFSFTVPKKVDSSTIKIIAKKIKLPYTIETTSSFYRIKSKIPAELTGKFVRINVFVTAELDCKGKDGWLVKVAEATNAPASTETKPEQAETKEESTEEDCE